MIAAIVMLVVGIGYGVLVDPVVRYCLRRLEERPVWSVWVETSLTAALPVSVAIGTGSLMVGGAFVVGYSATIAMVRVFGPAIR